MRFATACRSDDATWDYHAPVAIPYRQHSCAILIFPMPHPYVTLPAHLQHHTNAAVNDTRMTTNCLPTVRCTPHTPHYYPPPTATHLWRTAPTTAPVTPCLSAHLPVRPHTLPAHPHHAAFTNTRRTALHFVPLRTPHPTAHARARNKFAHLTERCTLRTLRHPRHVACQWGRPQVCPHFLGCGLGFRTRPHTCPPQHYTPHARARWVLLHALRQAPRAATGGRRSDVYRPLHIPHRC